MINKTFRLFVSSTFSDFVTERSILNDEIFPEIDEFCQSQGYNFQLIDLRWGVNNESALNQNTLAICLDEVKRCCILSPRPNFLLMVGERYGWIPLPAKISKPDFDKFIPFASGEERNLLKTWYILDENEIGGEYFLKTRTGKFIQDDIWSSEETRLHNALVGCVKRSGCFSEDTVKELTSSATEQEITEGMFSNEGVCGNAIALFRSGYPERDEDQTKIAALKRQIIEKMFSDGCENNLFELTWGNEYSTQFKKVVIDVLKSNISEEIKRLNTESKRSDTKEVLLREYISYGYFIKREPELNAISDYVNGEINAPLFIVGDSGSGKTTILSDFVINSGENVFSAFYGLDENSYSLIDSLRNIADEIKQEYDISYGIDVTAAGITEAVYGLVHVIPDDKKTIIIVDGLDMYHDIENIREAVFPSHLPSNVKIIVSMASGKTAQQFVTNNSHTLKIDKFSKEDSLTNLSMFLKERNRQIVSEKQKEKILTAVKNGATPLLLKLIAEISSSWHSGDEQNYLPDSVDETALLYLENMFGKFGHNKEFVLFALALAAASPYGITEDEIQLLMLRFPTVKDYFVSEDRYNHNLTKLPFVIWSRLFYDLKGCLTLTKTNGSIAVKFTHSVFSRVFTFKYGAYCRAADLMLENYYSAQESVFDTSIPNIRKSLVLPFILKKHNDIKKMSDLYNDLNFVNATVLIGGVDSTISNLCFLLGYNTDVSNREKLNSLFNCLQKNRDTLNCYCNGFFSCAASSGIIKDTKPIIETCGSKDDSSYKFFPYSYNSKIEWNTEGGKYAVYYRSYVYICDLTTGSELCRIFAEPIENGEMVSIKRVLWLSSSIIAAAAEEDGIYLYDVGGSIPNLIGKIKNKSITPNKIKYSKAHRLLFMQEGKMLIAINVDNCEQAYQISLHQKSKLGFDIFENELYIKKRNKKIDVYNAGTGTLTRQISVKGKTFYHDISIHRINDNLWFEKYHTGFSLAVYNISMHKKFYINPPFFQSEEDLVLGQKILLIVKSNVIVAIDLEDNLSMKYFKLPNIKNAFWKLEDRELSVLTADGLYIINTGDFVAFPADLSHCLALNRSAFSSASFLGAIMPNMIYRLYKFCTPIIKYLSNPENISYDFLFSDALTSGEVSIFRDSRIQTETIAEKSNDGKTAVAFENESAIIVYDAQNEPIAVIDKLKLGVDNNILKLCFSLDSRLLLLWCNHYIKVFDIDRGAEIITLNLSKRPALDVWIDSASMKLHITLCDQNEYTISLKQAKLDLKVLPKCILDRIDTGNNSQFVGPYAAFATENGMLVHQLLDTCSFFTDFGDNTTALTPHRWFTHFGIYCTSKNRLYYYDGEFYLNGDENTPFEHPFIDFSKSRLIEQLHDASPFKGYIREKNDLLSVLYEFWEKYLVLVSRMMNSIIVFDTKSMTVKAAHKVNGNIIGCRNINKTSIEITIDRAPYQIQFNINLGSD